MRESGAATGRRNARLADAVVLGVAILVAVVSARPYADSANDGSRLAVAEALVDYHTLAIDDSIFVKVPPPSAPRERRPYPGHHYELMPDGTIDRIRVGGHFYSDKPYTPSLYLAGWYQVLQWTTGLRARERADLFCYWMTVLSSGMAYVLAVWCVYRTGRAVGLSRPLQLLLAGSFGLGTVALPYCEHVNSHILMLAVAAGIMWILVKQEAGAKPQAVLLGLLAGLGYAIEQGVGQLLWGWTFLLVVFLRLPKSSRLRKSKEAGIWRGGLGRPAVLYVLAALPWMALHHAVNYHVGGTFGPANAVPAYFDYPGSQFDASNMTGRWNHEHFGAFLAYAGALLVSNRGFLCYNIPIWLALPGAVILLRGRKPGWPAVAFGVAWAVSTWLLYAALSNNFSGGCMSVRWFVPLLAPAYCIIALLLHHYPRSRGDFVLLSAWGVIEAAVMWYYGMWHGVIPGLWPILGGALVSWGAYRFVLWRRDGKAAPDPAGPTGVSGLPTG